MPSRKSLRVLLVVFRCLRLACLLLLLQTPAHASDTPFRLDDALGTPGWLTLSGQTRVRLEGLNGQFRAGGEGGDQAMMLRTLLKAVAHKDGLSLGVELQDSRVYLDDENTPLSGSYVDTMDVLQAYARAETGNLFGEGINAQLTLGRQTISIGSKRQIQRVSYANVIKPRTGAYLRVISPRGDEFHALYAVPVDILPSDRSAVGANSHDWNKEEWNRRIFGLHYRRPDILGAAVPGLWGELFIYGLNEKDREGAETPDRKHVNIGGRLYRRPSVGHWDVDLEGAWRVGSRHASSDPADTRPLDVNATTLMASVGYTFDNAWETRLATQYYMASGDDDPNDSTYGQYERLFNARRSDLNNTSLHGPLTPANIQAPGARVEVRPNDRLDARLAYSAAFLASATDVWTIAKLRDPSGTSGTFIGHTLDARLRYWLIPGNLRLEVGASALIFGEFAKKVPNGPAGNRTLFGYTQLAFDF